MAKAHTSQKRSQIDKANARMMLAVAISAFVVVFSLVASRALWIRQSYQTRVIVQKEKARDQLIANIDTVDELVVSYKAFVGTPANVIGGNPNGRGESDGDNAKIVLDSLPSKYDFPALATSLEKIAAQNNNKIASISGTDDEVAQSGLQEAANEPIAMPFELSATGSYQSVQDLLNLLQRSIRPIYVQKLDLTGPNANMQVDILAETYYQPERTLTIQKKVVK